jgi:hypothetical protein
VSVVIVAAAPGGTSSAPLSGRSLTRASDGPISELDASFRRMSKHYRLSLSLDSNPQRRPTALLTIELSRTLGIATQQHDYTFKLPALDCSTTLSFCNPVRTRHLMGAYGQLALRFVPQGPRIARPVDFPSCTGQKGVRRGALVGRMWFKPHNPALPGYRGKLRLRALATSETIYSCKPFTPHPTCHETGLTGWNTPTTAWVSFGEGSVRTGDVDFSAKAKTGWAVVAHNLVYNLLPSNVMTVAPDLSTATVDGTPLPFLTGSLKFVSDGKPPLTQASSCGTGTYTTGLVSGDLTAHFDGLAPSPVAPMNAMLGRVP